LPSFKLRTLPELIRLNVSLAVTLSAFSAYVTAYGKITPKAFFITGVFFLAAGASALNQYQERVPDSKMNRTHGRPVPAGYVSPATAVIIALTLLLTGSGILSCGLLWMTLGLGLFNILWYNGLYTWLKTRTAFAVVPGALTGVIPLLMGWTAAGGSLTDPRLLLLSFFLFMWQIPHFWLLMLQYGDEYRLAGFPAITDVFTIRPVKNIIFSWITGATGSSLLLVLSGVWHSFLPKLLIPGLNAFLLFFFLHELLISKRSRYRLLFLLMNVFLFMVLCLLIADKIIL
jgi:protoheme IX farnesyltransferase